MQMLIIENLKTGEANCEPYIPMPGQDDLIKGEHFKTEVVDSQLLALSYLDKPVDLKIDDEAIKKKILEALELSDWSQKEAAKLLGIKPNTLCRRCAKFDITNEKWYQVGNKKSRLKLIRKKA